MMEELRLDGRCFKCREFQEIKDVPGEFSDDDLGEYWSEDDENHLDENHLKYCDEERLTRQFYDDDHMYCDPWTKGIVHRAGPALKDVTFYGEDSITLDILEHIPNLTALRLVWHHPLIRFLLPERCNSLVTLEFVGQHTMPHDIIEHFTNYNYTPLRALAIFNVASKREGAYTRSAITVVNIVALGMS